MCCQEQGGTQPWSGFPKEWAYPGQIMENLCARFWVESQQELLGWVVVQPLLGTGQILGKRIPGILFFGRTAAGTVTDDGPGPESGRKELRHIWEWKHKGRELEGFAVLRVWKNMNTVMRQRKNGG